MGLLTTFLSLFKPGYTDSVDIADINSNMDKIDARFKGIDDGTFSVKKATKLATARQINGVNFNGESNITITAAANGGTSAACSGNAASATKLASARTINGVSFNGTANITIADSTKAPTSHASTGTGYGVGTTANYGHVKTINALTQTSHLDGTALSAYQGKVLKDLIDSKMMSAGIYTGNGVASRTIATGFRPKAVLLTTKDAIFTSGSLVYGGLAIDGYPIVTSDGGTAIAIASNGFTVGSNITQYGGDVRTNASDTQYRYIAIK